MNLEIASLLLILFAVIIIVWGIAVVHTLPGKIAKKRGHSQVEAIEFALGAAVPAGDTFDILDTSFALSGGVSYWPSNWPAGVNFTEMPGVIW
jgi:hypothetical protein